MPRRVERPTSIGDIELNSMIISVIIPVYNAETTISRCLRSLDEATRACKCATFEVVCVDDGSDDGSAGLLDQAAVDFDWLRVVHQENSGASAARNVGIDCACGLYVVFLDADDEVSSGYFEHLMPLLESCSYDCVLFGIELVDDIGNASLPGVALSNDAVGAADDFIRAILDPQSCYQGFVAGKAVRRSLLEDACMRFDTSILILEDEWFWLQIAPRCESVYFSAAVLYRYYIRAQSATSDVNRDGGWADLEMRERIVSLVRINFPFGEVYARQRLRIKTCALVRRFYVAGDSVSLKRLRPLWSKARAGHVESVRGVRLPCMRRLQIMLCDAAMLLHLPCALLAPLRRLLASDNARLRQEQACSSGSADDSERIS